MSTTYGATGLGQTAASARRFSSFFKRYWDAFQERRERERLRAILYGLSDWELKDKALCATRSTTSPRTEVSTREASDPPDERLISGTGWMAGIGHDQMHHPNSRLQCGSKGGIGERRETLLATV